MNTQQLSEYAKNLLDRQAFVESNLSALESILNSAEKNACGLTLDSAKTPAWEQAKKQYSIYWAAYRRINIQLSKIRKVARYEVVNGKRVAIYQYNN